MSYHNTTNLNGKELKEAKCEIRGDEFIESLNSNFKKATEKDWQTTIKILGLMWIILI